MTKIVPDFRAYCKQDKLPSYNYLDQDYPIKLPTQTRDEPSLLTWRARFLHAHWTQVTEDRQPFFHWPMLDSCAGTDDVTS